LQPTQLNLTLTHRYCYDGIEMNILEEILAQINEPFLGIIFRKFLEKFFVSIFVREVEINNLLHIIITFEFITL